MKWQRIKFSTAMKWKEMEKKVFLSSTMKMHLSLQDSILKKKVLVKFYGVILMIVNRANWWNCLLLRKKNKTLSNHYKMKSMKSSDRIEFRYWHIIFYLLLFNMNFFKLINKLINFLYCFLFRPWTKEGISSEYKSNYTMIQFRLLSLK